MSTSSSESSKMKHVWNRLSHLFSSDTASDRRLSTSSNESSVSSMSNLTSSTSSSPHRVLKNRNNLRQSVGDYSSMKIPPFSPTYCKDNEFPYSNFYVKLPDGRWMIKYRSGKRDSLGTDIFEGYMI